MQGKITSEIAKEIGLAAGATVVGIAAASDFVLAPEGFKPVDVLPECRSVVVLGATFPREVLNDTDEYTESRNTMLTTMTAMAKTVEKRMKADGCKTKAVSASGGKWVQGDGRKEQFGAISLKHAAQLAGLGVIGKNYLLTSPQYGNLLWFSAVLTSAELAPNEKAVFDMCAGCNKCVEACPVGALDDLGWYHHEFNDASLRQNSSYPGVVVSRNTPSIPPSSALGYENFARKSDTFHLVATPPSAFGKKGCSSHFKIEDKKLKIKCFLCRTVCPYCFGAKAK